MQRNKVDTKTNETKNDKPQGLRPLNSISNDRGRLPEDPTQALRALIKMTQNLTHLSERENYALTMNDMIGFAIMQDEKNVMAERYAKMSQNFRKRLEDFRGSDSALLDKLEEMQNRLAEQSAANSKFIDKMAARSRATTQNTLFNAQELAQRSPVFVPNNDEAKTQNADEAVNAE